MDIKLNVPTNNTSNFLGNNSVTSLQTEKGQVFTDIFDNLGEGDDSKDIDLNLLLTLLNNPQIKNTEHNMEVIEEQDINLNGIPNINDFDIDGEITTTNLTTTNSIAINPITINSMDINSIDINNAMVNLIKNGESLDLNNEEYELVKKFENDNSLINSDINETNDIGYKDIIEANHNGYDDLEMKYLNNKNAIVKSSYIDKGDKELNTLESILNYEDMSEAMKIDTEEVEISNSEVEEVEISNTETIESNNLEPKLKNDELIFTNNTNLNKELSPIDHNDNNAISQIRKDFFSEDTVKMVKYLSANGMEEITIKISPRELGDMTIKLIKSGDETTIDITINKEDVFSLVNDNISEIKKHLENLNISVKDVSVNIKSNNQNYFSHNFNQEFNRKNQQNHEKFNKKQILNNEEENDERDSIKGENNLNILV